MRPITKALISAVAGAAVLGTTLGVFASLAVGVFLEKLGPRVWLLLGMAAGLVLIVLVWLVRLVQLELEE